MNIVLTFSAPNVGIHYSVFTGDWFLAIMCRLVYFLRYFFWYLFIKTLIFMFAPPVWCIARLCPGHSLFFFSFFSPLRSPATDVRLVHAAILKVLNYIRRIRRDSKNKILFYMWTTTKTHGISARVNTYLYMHIAHAIFTCVMSRVCCVLAHSGTGETTRNPFTSWI